MADVALKDAAELIAASTLEAIEVYSVQAHRDLDAEPSPPQEIVPQYTIVIDLNTDAAEFRVRLETVIALASGQISCGVLARYTYSGVAFHANSGEALAGFVNSVAIIHIIPYVRQTIADMAIRTFGRTLLMPIIQQGQITFELETDVLREIPD